MPELCQNLLQTFVLPPFAPVSHRLAQRLHLPFNGRSASKTHAFKWWDRNALPGAASWDSLRTTKPPRHSVSKSDGPTARQQEPASYKTGGSCTALPSCNRRSHALKFMWVIYPPSRISTASLKVKHQTRQQHLPSQTHAACGEESVGARQKLSALQHSPAPGAWVPPGPGYHRALSCAVSNTTFSGNPTAGRAFLTHATTTCQNYTTTGFHSASVRQSVCLVLFFVYV